MYVALCEYACSTGNITYFVRKRHISSNVQNTGQNQLLEVQLLEHIKAQLIHTSELLQDEKTNGAENSINESRHMLRSCI